MKLMIDGLTNSCLNKPRIGLDLALLSVCKNIVILGYSLRYSYGFSLSFFNGFIRRKGSKEIEDFQTPNNRGLHIFKAVVRRTCQLAFLRLTHDKTYSKFG
jgi:hypothetical protein